MIMSYNLILTRAIKFSRFKVVLAILLSFGFAGCGEGNDPSPLTSPNDEIDVPLIVDDQGNVPVIAVYVDKIHNFPVDENGEIDISEFMASEPSIPEPGVIVAIWADGRIVWSGKPIEGGPPYYKGNIGSQKVESTLVQLDQKGILKYDSFPSNTGPDAPYTVIAIVGKDRQIGLSSWHELYETNPDVVASFGGIGFLEGRNRKEVLDNQPEHYRRFRKVWKQIRNKLSEVIPAEGQPAKNISFKWKHQLKDTD